VRRTAGYGAYAVRRLGYGVVLVVGITLVAFVLTHLVPSNPALVYAGLHPNPAQIARARQILGLDKPLYVQYLLFLRGLATGAWGISITTHGSVFQNVMTFLPPTLELVFFATLESMVLGVLLGVWASERPGGVADVAVRVLGAGLVSMPAFWLALLMQIVFFGQLHLLPLTGEYGGAYVLTARTITGFPLLDAALSHQWALVGDELRHLVLPSLALAAYSIGLVARMTRATMLDALGTDYIRLAVANGVHRRRIYFRYALKNAIAPTLTVLGLTFAYSLTGDFFVEQIFFWNGLGSYSVHAIDNLDIAAVMGVLVVVSLAYTVINLAVDLIRALFDPRLLVE
jgi:ABC-type dipeptide/oligopeptide/nickel transport system permease component